jgi:hypothetical protein
MTRRYAHHTQRNDHNPKMTPRRINTTATSRPAGPEHTNQVDIPDDDNSTAHTTRARHATPDHQLRLGTQEYHDHFARRQARARLYGLGAHSRRLVPNVGAATVKE